MNIKVVGVVGAGVMGTGVAQSLAQAGHRVILLDISEEILKRAREEIAKNIRFQRLFSKTKDQESVDAIVTDSAARLDLIDALRSRAIQVVVAPPGDKPD